MSDILNKQITLKLNSHWVAVGHVLVRDAITFLCSENGGQKPGYAMDYQTVIDENGESVLAYATPVGWDEWIQLPVRDGDLAINTGRGQIRVPLVVVCANYAKVPTKTARVSAGTIRDRDGGICQYTGRKLARGDGNLDHVIPRSRGGRDTFENLVWADKQVNTLKADRTPEEAGLRLIRRPKAPPSMPVVITAQDARHPSQRPFLL